jgi:hypothetical protein
MVENQPSRGVGVTRVWKLARLTLVGLSIAALLTLVARHHWLADILANLRIQQLIGITAVLVVCIVIRRPWGMMWAIVLGLAHFLG